MEHHLGRNTSLHIAEISENVKPVRRVFYLDIKPKRPKTSCLLCNGNSLLILFAGVRIGILPS